MASIWKSQTMLIVVCKKLRLETNDKLEMSVVTELDWRLTVRVKKKTMLVNPELCNSASVEALQSTLDQANMKMKLCKAWL